MQIRCMRFRQRQFIYMGHIIPSQGLSADSEKLKAINDTPPPSCKQGARVQRIFGMQAIYSSLRANATIGQTFRGNSSKFNLAHILRLGRP